MQVRERVRSVTSALKCLNICSLSVALQKPKLLRPYLSMCLRKYDEILGRGLPTKNIVRQLNPSDQDNVVIPARFRTGGGTEPGELLTLAAVTRLLRPRRIFEIGTFNGRTTATFILNSSPDCEIFTLDLPPEKSHLSGYLSSDIALVHDRRPETFLKRAGLAHRYRQIYCDSMLFDPEPFRDSIELGFIDGAHAEEFVRNDTLKMAIMMASRGYVLWHDYGGQGSFRPLARFLESLPIEIYRVPSTTLAWTTAAEIKKLAAPAIVSRAEDRQDLYVEAG